MKAILDSLEGVADAMRSEYTEIREGALKGKFMLKVESVEGFVLENVTNLKSSLSKQKEEIKSLKAKFEELGEDFDVAKAKEALAKLEEMKNWKPDEKVQAQIDAVKKELSTKHSREMTEKDSRLASLNAELDELLIVAEGTRSIAAHGGNAKLLLPHLRAMCRVSRDPKTKKPFAEVLGPDGNPKITNKTGSEAPMSIDELVESMKSSEDFAAAFKGSGASGSAGAASKSVQPTQGSGSGSYVDQLRQERRTA